MPQAGDDLRGRDDGDRVSDRRSTSSGRPRRRAIAACRAAPRRRAWGIVGARLIPGSSPPPRTGGSSAARETTICTPSLRSARRCCLGRTAGRLACRAGSRQRKRTFARRNGVSRSPAAGQPRALGAAAAAGVAGAPPGPLHARCYSLPAAVESDAGCMLTLESVPEHPRAARILVAVAAMRWSGVCMPRVKERERSRARAAERAAARAGT